MTDRELMQQALDALEWNLPVIQDYGDKEQLNIQHNAITALRDRLEQPEPVTGNILKDAYNAMVEKKTRSQKLREAGFTRRPKGWEKEKDEQEPVAWAGVDFAIDCAPPQRKPLAHPQIHELDWPDGVSFDDILSFVRAIEEAHGIKEKNT